MLELLTSYTFSQIPYLTNDALDTYAEGIIAEFSPDALSAPVPVDVETLARDYLGLIIHYRNISFERKMLGITSFEDGYIPALNEETGQIEQMAVTAGTVVIDSSLTAKRNIARLRFTIAHEGAHWLLHRKAFTLDNPFGPVGIYENQYLAAKEGRIDCKRRHKIRSDADRIEQQADFLASAILMPRPAIRSFFQIFLAGFGEKPCRLIRGKSSADDYLAIHLPLYIASRFNVSQRAARIRLEKLGAIV